MKKPINSVQAKELLKALEPKKPKIGRPTDFNPVVAERICLLTAQRHSMEEIASMEGLPGEATIYRWLATTGVTDEEKQAYAAFREELARAREIRAEGRASAIESYIRRLTDHSVPKEERLDAQQVRAAVEAQTILMAIEAPKKYGKSVTVKGDRDNPVEVRSTRFDLTDEQLAAIAAGGLKNST